MKHIFIVNRQACDGKAGQFWDSIQPQFLEAFPDAEVICPGSAAATRDYAAKLAAAGSVRLVSVGGEGAMNSVANGVLSVDADDTVSIALVPFGNVNDYAANIGLKKTWQHALETLRIGKQVKVGAIRLRADAATAYALNISDVGFGATTAKSHSVDRQLRWLKGQFKYTILALKTLLRWQNVPARVTVDAEVIEGEVAILLAGFSPTLGGFHLCPGASPTADEFSVSIGLNVGKLQILGLMDAAKRNRLSESENILFRKASRLQIDAVRPMVAEVDGEIVNTSCRTVLFESLPRRLNFVVPPDSSHFSRAPNIPGD
jgi:YegS/Rv2252/BmrU family lipid kinase